MPWSRWMQSKVEENNCRLDVIRSDSNSAGSQFASMADNLAARINGVDSVASMEVRSIPTFTRTQSLGDGSLNALASPVVTFNPPSPGRAYRVSIIANIRASGGGLGYARSRLLVDGEMIGTWSPNLRPSSADPSIATLSIMSTSAAAKAGAVTAQFSLNVSPSFNSQTVTFSDCTMTAIFYGGL